MKKDNLPSLKGMWGKLNKLLIFLVVIVITLSSIGLFIIRDFGYGYKYYQVENSQAVLIGVSQQENFIDKTVQKYIENLENEGYVVASYNLDKFMFTDYCLIRKSKINDNFIKEAIEANLIVNIFTTKLTITGDETIYYFKTENECNKFINKLNEYIKQDSIIESEITSFKVITSQQVLDNKMNSVITEKQKKDAAAAEQAKKKQAKVTSRGGYSRNSNYKGGAPMASYVYISSYYGKRGSGNHTGVDFAASTGTHIYAWKDGIVTTAKWNGSYGNFIEIKHNDGIVSRYAHLSGYAVSKGTTVSKGQTIGYCGNTGNSTGPHLHFEIKVNGSFVNPLNYL